MVLWELQDSIGILTLNRPNQLNAMNHRLLEEFGTVLEEEAADEDVRAVVITGAGDRAFAAGADLGVMKDFDEEEAREWSLLGQRAFSAVEDLGKPVVAAVNGFALGGGCELALACDLRIASENAVLGQPEVSLGIPPGFGASYRLPRVVGQGVARDLLLTGRQLDAAAARDIGLVSEVVPADELMETSRRRAGQIARHGPTAVQLVKELLARGAGLGREEATQLEASSFSRAYGTDEPHEGMSAFLQKRDPHF